MKNREYTFKEKVNNFREIVKSVTCKSGWSLLKAMYKMSNSKKKIGVPYIIYDRYNFYKYSLNEQKEKYQVIVEEYEKKQEEIKAKAKQVREKAIKDVMEKTGWSRQKTKEEFKRARRETGVSPRHYVAYRFWEVTEEEQKTYFTKGHSTKLKEKYNCDFQGVIKITSKDAFNTFFADYIGRKWASTTCTYEEFAEKFAMENKVIYKPSRLSGGEGIISVEIDQDNLKAAYDELAAKPEGIIETFIVQHPEMAKLSRRSVNTIRVVTIMTHNKNKGIEPNVVHIVYAGMRMGRGDGILDNLHAGGLIAGIDLDTGIITTDGVDYENNVFENHPDTGEKIKGFTIPFFKEAIDMVKEAGAKTEGYFGWDVAITEQGPILIEANTSPGAGILQIPYALEHKGMLHVVEKYL